jgi:hypothetical protein
MPIRVVCPQCGKALNAPDTAAGKVASCPACKGKIAIPGASAMPAAPVVAQAAVPAALSAAPVIAPAAIPLAAPAAVVPPPVTSVIPPLPVAKPVILPAIPVGGPPVVPAVSPDDPMAAFALETFGGSTEGGIALGAKPLTASPLAAGPRARRNSGNYVPLIIIAGAVLGAGVLMGGIYWLTRGGGGDWMKWMPDDAQVVAHINMQAFLPYIDDFKQTNPQVQKELDKLARESRMTPEEIKSVSIGMARISGGTQSVVGVIQKTSAVTDANIGKAPGARSEQVGEYTIYYSANNEALCKVDDYTVIGGEPATLKAVLSRTGEARLSPALQRAIDEANFSADVAVAASLQGLPAAGPMPMPGLDPTKFESAAISAYLGSSVRLSAALICADSDTASDLKTKADLAMKQAEPMIGMMSAQNPALQEAWDSISIGRSGAKLTLSVTIPESLIEQAKQQAAGIGPPRASGGGFGGGGFNNGF